MGALTALMLAALGDDYRTLLDAEGRLPADASAEPKKLEQTVWPELAFVHFSGWAEGGHRRLLSHVLAVKGGATYVVVPDFENIDEEGNYRRLRTLWLCPLAHALDVARSGSDIDRLMKLIDARSSVCSALTPARCDDRIAAFVAAVALEEPDVQLLKSRRDLDPKLKALLQTRDSGHDAAWVSAAVEFQPWASTSKGKGYAGLGMVSYGPQLALLEVRCEKQQLSLVAKSVAFVRQYIE